MACPSPVKMKRKGPEEVHDELLDFSLFSPAMKIRRLDLELPSTMEEAASLGFEQSSPGEHMIGNTEQQAVPVEEAPSLPLNEERALILYKPINTPLLQSPSSSNFSFTVNADLIPGFKDHVFWLDYQNGITEEQGQTASNEKPSATSGSLAVIPWMPSQFHMTQETEDSAMDDRLLEPMEADEYMEVEDVNVFGGGKEARVLSGVEGSEGLHQWQQQPHCMIPQVPPNVSTPIT